MVSFVVGVGPGPEEAERLERFSKLMEYVMDFEGLEEVTTFGNHPYTALLSFEDKASAIAAQWQLELNGSEGINIL